ncbi:hypothetical protein GEMRC1_002610 [Eukaryota sp. GEM-RC1]
MDIHTRFSFTTEIPSSPQSLLPYELDDQTVATSNPDNLCTINTCSSLSSLPLQPSLSCFLEDKPPAVTLTPHSLHVLGNLLAYNDLLYIPHNHIGKADDPLLFATCIHTINHVMSLQKSIDQNDTLVKQEEPGPFLDQGFTRPSVLILLPFRSNALKTVKYLLSLLPGKREITNQKRLNEEFGVLGSNDGYGDVIESRSSDWNNVFYGNIDDCFVLPISIGKKQVRLFSSFKHADIIVASPMGLEMIMKKEKSNFPHLSSISLVFADFVDVIYQQNWEHF